MFVLAGLAAEALAQSPTPCAARDVWVERLKQKFDERQFATAQLPNGEMLEIWATPNGATWTILRTFPNGVSCMLAGGQNFEPGHFDGLSEGGSEL